MTRLKKSRRAVSRRIESAAPPAGQPQAFFSGYQGASFSTDRGAIFWPTIDTRQELDSFSRYEIIRRIHWLKAHFGFVRGLIKNSADLVGWQTPQAQSGDAAWDDLAEEAFRDVTAEAAAFDVAGKFDFDSAQPMLMRAALTDAQVLEFERQGRLHIKRIMYRLEEPFITGYLVPEALIPAQPGHLYRRQASHRAAASWTLTEATR